MALEGVDAVFYAFAEPTPEGGLEPVPHPDRLRALVRRGEREGFEVHLSLGGWNDGDDSAFETLAEDSLRRAAFSGAVAATVSEYGLDGADLDWEHPDLGPSSQNYLALVRELADSLHARGGRLAVSVAGSWAWGGDGIRPEVFDHADRVHVMAYSGGYGPHHSSFRYARSALDLYLDMGAPAGKLHLGVPFFGATPDGETRLFGELLAADSTAASRNSTDGFYYDGAALLRQKVALARAEGLAGLIAWDLTADAAGAESLRLILVEEAKGSAER